MIRATAQHLADRLAYRPPEYLREIEPAIVARNADGSIDFDDTHPAWRAAMVKYRPVRPSASAPLAPAAVKDSLFASRMAVCAQCDEYNGNICELLGGCWQSFRAFLADGRSRCPLNKL